MSTIDTSTWSPDSSLNTDIGGIPLNADASIQQTWQAIQMLMAALKGDTAAIELTINQPDGTTIVATNQTLTVVDNGHAHAIANVTGLQTALDGKASTAGMTGATSSADGASGLVPKPEAGDQDKALKGDGTWGTVAAASHTHGNITNDGKLGTASRAVVTDGNKAIDVSGVTATELGYLSGVTSALQTQLDAKAADSGVVHLTGAETITGQKTFSSKIQGSISGSATDVDLSGDGTDLASARGQIGDCTALSSPVNYNSQTKTGQYYVSYSAQNTNGPHTLGSLLLVFAMGNSHIAQICKAINQTVLYVRHNYSGTWSVWRQIFEASALGDGLKLTSGKLSVPEYSGATSSADGTSGLVPPASSAERTCYLRGDGDWVDLETRLSSVEQRLTALGG